MSNREELMLANADIMTIIAHARKIGWDTISINSLQRIVYLMKVLYAFTLRFQLERVLVWPLLRTGL